ncbi:hypothetical protein FRC14_008260 [Serendipita sp. 396]|nr:hypothetical protein FRC14_008260 [Serendipita sp. 396]KAG8864165.1 hypothetical protein FRC20_010339 [Serendipita sp. 405]
MSYDIPASTSSSRGILASKPPSHDVSREIFRSGSHSHSPDISNMESRDGGNSINYSAQGMVPALWNTLQDSEDPERVEREIRILSTEDLNLPSSYGILDGMSFEDLAEQLSDYSSCMVVALVPIFGPYPYYRMPKQYEKIGVDTRHTFVVPHKEMRLLVVVRTQDQETVISFTCPDEQRRPHMSMVEVLSPIVQQAGGTIRWIIHCLDGRDISQSTFSMYSKPEATNYPTVALVDTSDA